MNTRLACRLALLLGIALLFVSPVSAAEADKQAKAIAETVRQLQRIEITDEIPSTVPPAARSLLKELKHQLRDFLVEMITERASLPVDPVQLQSKLLARFKENGVRLSDDCQANWTHGYGCIADINLEYPPNHKQVLAVTTTLAIPCGQDTSLYIFEQQEARWKLVLAQESNDYEEIKGAQGSFGYAVSPPDDKGEWFVVAVDINPWCTSVWQGIRYKVLRPGPDPYESKLLLSRHEGVNLNYEPAYKILTGRNEFTLIFGGDSGLDSANFYRAHIAKYKIEGNKAERVPPIAFRPHDFVDEWIELPWEEAARWVGAANVGEIHSWHSKLQRGQDWHYFAEIEFVQPCSKEGGQWQVGVAIESKGPPPLPSMLYFTVSRKDATFHLQRVDATRPPGCPGETSPEQPEFELP